jgi:hypothetical protein
MVSFEEDCKSRFLDGFVEEGTPLPFLLSLLDLVVIEKHIEETYYSDENRFHFNVGLMIRLTVLKAFRKLSFRKTVSSLTDDDCHYLKIPVINDEYLIPSASALHHFVKERLGEDGFNDLMVRMASQIVRSKNEKQEVIIDSTPLEASRYDNYADFNEHYKIKMDKAHILHWGDYPLLMIHSTGNSYDGNYVLPLLKMTENKKIPVSSAILDGGYDSFSIHAHIWNYFNVHPLIQMRDNAVLHKEGTIPGINKQINKMWKIGGDVHEKNENKLKFLYANGQTEKVGMYFRNQNILDPDFDLKCSSRSNCERKHSHIKNIVDFDIRGIPNQSKNLYTLMKFVAYQILMLAHTQLKFEDLNCFRKYV